MKDEELKLHSIFSGAPNETEIWDRTKLEFSTPIICDRIKVEFDEVTLDESFGHDYSVAVGNILFISPFSFVQTPAPTPIATPAATSTPTPTPLPTATMTPTPAETTPTEIIVEHDNLNNDLSYNKTVENFDAITVNIKVTNFTGINHTDNGGAIYVANAGFKCSKTKFVDCSSTEAGGGIHLSYLYDYENSYELDSLIFIHCTAQYGGAVYLYSSSRRNSVQISGCHFMNNIALRTKSKDRKFGGSAIFMTAKTGEIKSNTMVDNSGDSAVKIYNHFSRSASSINKLMDLEQDTVIISECKFENSKKSLGFIYYFLGNGASKFELRNCYFYGELKEGAHYIDGKALSKNGPKLTIKKCRFAMDSKRAHNLDPSVISVDLDDQYFNYSDDHKSFNWWKVIVTVAVPAVVIAIIIFVIVFVNKHKNNNIIDEYEMAERSFIISENDNELNVPSV